MEWRVWITWWNLLYIRYSGLFLIYLLKTWEMYDNNVKNDKIKVSNDKQK